MLETVNQSNIHWPLFCWAKLSADLNGHCQQFNQYKQLKNIPFTHWGRVTNIGVGNLTIIGSDNGLSPGRRQAIIRTNAGILLIGTLGTNLSEIVSEIHTFSRKKMHLKMLSAKWRLFCLGLIVLIAWFYMYQIHADGQFYGLAHWGRDKMPDTFRRKHFQMHFLLWKPSCLVLFSTGVCS